MADIKFYCPECQSKLAVDESAAGYFVECPRCGKRIRIPAESSAAPPRLELPHKEAAREALGRTQRLGDIVEAAARPNLTERIKRLEEERRQFEEALREEQSRHESITQVEAKVADLLQQVETANAAQQMAEDNARRLIKEKRALNDKLAKAGADLEAATKTAAQTAERVATLEEDLKKRAAELEEAAAKTRAQQERIAELEKQTAHAGETAARVGALEEQVKSLESELAAARTAAEENSSRTRELEQVRKQAEGISAKLADSHNRIDKLTRERNDLAQHIADAERARDEALQTISDLQARVKLLTSEKKKLTETITFAQAETQRIKEQVQLAREQAAETERLKTRVAELEKELERKRSAPPPRERTAAKEPGPAARAAGDAGTAPAGPAPRPEAKAAPAVTHPAPRTHVLGGSTMYRKPGGARPRSHWNRRHTLSLGILLLLGVAALALYLARGPGGLNRYSAQLTTVFTARQPGPAASKTEETPAGGDAAAALHPLNTPVLIDGVEITVRAARIAKIARVDALGNERPSEKPYLVLDLALENKSPSRSIFMLHTWDQSTLTDNLNHVMRPAFPSRFTMDRIVGTLGASEIDPGERLEDKLVFETPPDDATNFTLVSDPGFWEQTRDGRSVPLSRNVLKVAFSRNDIEEAR